MTVPTMQVWWPLAGVVRSDAVAVNPVMGSPSPDWGVQVTVAEADPADPADPADRIERVGPVFGTWAGPGGPP